MYVYADESGNSGRNLFDSRQPIHRQGAILTLTDIEEACTAIIRPLLSGAERLHAHEIAPREALEIGRRIVESLNTMDAWEFHVTAIEKQYVATTKFVDLLFDSGENPNVPQHWYYFEPFRHLICACIDDAFTNELRQRFWNAFLGDDVAAIVEVAREIADRTKRQRYAQRIRQIVQQGLSYAQQDPHAFTLSAAQTRRSYQAHTPNIVAFTVLVQAMHAFSDKYGKEPIQIVYDHQQEFSRTMQEHFKQFSSLIFEDGDGFPMARMSQYGLPDLTMKSSRDSFALQAVDLLLWTEQRPRDDQFDSFRLLYAGHINQFALSRQRSEDILHYWKQKLGVSSYKDYVIRAIEAHIAK